MHLGKHGSLEWLPGKNAALSASCAHRRRDRRPAADLPVPGQRPRRGRAGQAPRARHDRRPPDPADGARRDLRRHRPARAAARRARQHRGDGPGQAAGDARRDLDADAGRRDAPRPRPGASAPTTRSSTTSSCTSTAGCARSRTSRSATGCTCSARRPTGEARVNLVLAILRAAQVWGGESARRARPARGAGPRGRRRRHGGAVDEVEAAGPRAGRAAWRTPAGTRPRAARRCTTTRRCSGCCAFAADRGRAAAGRHDRRARRRAARPRRRLRPRRPVAARRCAGWSTCCRPAATSTPSTRGRCPRGWPGRPGQAMADSLLAALPRRHRRLPASVGLSVWGTSRDAHLRRRHRRGARAARRAARVGRGVAPRQRTSSVVPLDELGRPRIDVTVRISGFFRDAFPHVVAMLDDAVRLVADLDEPRRAQLRARPRARRPRRARRRAPGDDADLRLQARARTAPASCRSIESGTWRDDDDLAEVYTAWGGFAYGRDLDGAPAADDMRANYRRIKVAAKNIDTREHDIADSDDYFQYHGGMVATVRALTGARPQGVRRRLDHARRGAHPHAAGGDRPGLPRPRGQPALDRRDAAPRLQGRLRARRDRRLPLRLRRHRRRRARLDVRARSPRSTSSTRPTRSSCSTSNPWALRGIVERLHEAVDRGLWEEPDPERAGRDAAGLPRRRGRPRGPVSERARGSVGHRHGARSTSRPRRREALRVVRLRDRRRQGARRPAPRPAPRASATEHGVAAGRRPRPAARPRPTRRDYAGAVRDWHDARVAAYEHGAARARRRPRRSWCGATRRSTTRRSASSSSSPSGCRSSATSCPASARPSCSRPGTGSCCTRSAAPVHVTTARLLRDDIAAGQTNLVVMLDGRARPDRAGGLVASGAASTWAPTPRSSVAGRVGDVLPDLESARARAKAAAGWVMDVHLLRAP